MHNKKSEIKKCIEYYKNNIKSDDYKKYRKQNKNEEVENHLEYLKTEKPQWLDRDDYYFDSEGVVITHVAIGDVLSNAGINKLLRKLYSLSDKEYIVNNYYKKPTIINKYDYIHLQYGHYYIGKFAEIKFLKDDFIDSIEISWTQINSYYAFMEYNFLFKKCIDQDLYDTFIYENISKINSSKDYFSWYRVTGNQFEDFMTIDQMNEEYFPLICQHFITSILYSEQGNKYTLANLIYITRNASINISKLYLSDMGMAYYSKEGNFVIVSDFDGINNYLLAGNNQIPNFHIAYYISKYGNEFYNRFFIKRDLNIFETIFSKFSTGRKKITYNKDFYMLLNKLQSVSEVENKNFDNFYDEFKKNWDFYICNDKKNLKKFHKKVEIDLKKIYETNFTYIKLCSEINYSKSNRNISIVAAVTSIIAMIISWISILHNC